MSDPAYATEGGAAAPERPRPPAWLKGVLRADIWITGLFFAGLTLVTFFGVVMRYFLNQPFVWLEEVQLALFIGVVYIGAGSAFRHGSHVAIDFLVEMFPAALRRAVEILVHVIVVVVLGYFAWQGLTMTMGMVDSGRVTSILRFPSFAIYAMIPIGLVWAIVNCLYTAVFGEDIAPEVGI